MTTNSKKEHNLINTYSVTVEKDETKEKREQERPEKDIGSVEIKDSSMNNLNGKKAADTAETSENEEIHLDINNYDIEEIELDETLSALENAEILAKHYQVPNIIIKSLFNLNFNKKKPFTNRYGSGNLKGDLIEDDVGKFLLALEKQIIEFVLKSEQDSLKLNPMNSYYRLLSHQLADYYHMGHILSNDGTSMVLYKINTSLINADDETKKHAKFDQSGNIKPLDFRSLKFDPKEKLNRIKLAEIYELHKGFFEKYKDSLVNEFEGLHFVNSPPIISYPDSFHSNPNIQPLISAGNYRNADGRGSVFDDSEDDAEVVVGGENPSGQSESDNSTKQKNERRGKGFGRRAYSNQYYYQPYGYYSGPAPATHVPQQSMYPNVVPMPGVIPVTSPPIGSPTIPAPYYYYPIIPAASTDDTNDEKIENGENPDNASPATPSTQSSGSPVGPQIINPATYSPIASVLPIPNVSGIPPVAPNGQSGVNPRGMYSYQYYPVPGPPGSAPMPMMYYDTNSAYSNRGGKRYNRRGRNGRHGDKYVETS